MPERGDIDVAFITADNRARKSLRSTILFRRALPFRPRASAPGKKKKEERRKIRQLWEGPDHVNPQFLCALVPPAGVAPEAGAFVQKGPRTLRLKRAPA